MQEIVAEQFQCVLPLLAQAAWQPVVPRAVCEGFNPGRVFVDRTHAPTAALIWLPCGYFYLCGQPPALADQTLADRMRDDFVPAWRAAGERGLVLAALSPGWQDVLEGFMAGKRHARIYRRAFTLDVPRFEPSPPPQGFRLRRVDAALAARLGGMPSWRSPEAFLAHGVGYCLLQEEEIVAHCTSVFVTRSQVEIDVQTGEAFRRRGLAHAAASALIAACLKGGREPNWECFWNNESSNALAASLGFVKSGDHGVFYWEPEE